MREPKAGKKEEKKEVRSKALDTAPWKRVSRYREPPVPEPKTPPKAKQERPRTPPKSQPPSRTKSPLLKPKVEPKRTAKVTTFEAKGRAEENRTKVTTFEAST